MALTVVASLVTNVAVGFCAGVIAFHLVTRITNGRKEVRQMAKDPVCGMEVDEEKAAATSEYQGVTYYFCSKGCKVAFDKEPEKYLQGQVPHG